ncbi:hypothetical protein GAO09_00220 [Rhizobiales bacterium RZME27]|uniref:Uncharacterized protein n=1 Tax=Endobacterium cereale TaxID=2663029 RepID=A0A6A8A1Q1_9HYPH|nr:hypothetical protein [Endobacterium cereale]
MVNWRALEAGVDRKMAATFGEEVRLAFKNSGVADSGRPDTDIRALLYTAGNIPTMLGPGFTTMVSAGQGVLVIDRSTYSGSDIFPKDKVRATERAGQPWWEVAEVTSRHSNLIVLSLTQK